jgi:hypothetical protein
MATTAEHYCTCGESFTNKLKLNHHRRSCSGAPASSSPPREADSTPAPAIASAPSAAPTPASAPAASSAPANSSALAKSTALKSTGQAKSPGLIKSAGLRKAAPPEPEPEPQPEVDTGWDNAYLEAMKVLTAKRAEQEAVERARARAQKMDDLVTSARELTVKSCTQTMSLSNELLKRMVLVLVVLFASVGVLVAGFGVTSLVALFGNGATIRSFLALFAPN